MARNTQIILGDGNLGGVPIANDGISLLVITRPSSYTFTGGATTALVRNLADVEALGVTEATDDSNNALVWEHIKDFYVNAPSGTLLHIVLLADTVTLTDMFTSSNQNYTTLTNYITAQQGSIKLIGVALNPAASEVATANGISDDLAAAIPLASAFRSTLFDAGERFVICLEGRKFDAVANPTNLTTLNAPFISVMVARDAARQTQLNTTVPISANYAMVGYLSGVLAGRAVNISAGRVKSGQLLGITRPSFSDGDLITSQPASYLNTLDDRSYLFFTPVPQNPGFYLNDDWTCEARTDDYRQIKLCRTINKVSDIVARVYNAERNESFLINPENGQLTGIEVKRLESAVETALLNEMINLPVPEISSATATILLNQNVLTTGVLSITVDVVPTAGANIRVTVQFRNPAN